MVAVSKGTRDPQEDSRNAPMQTHHTKSMFDGYFTDAEADVAPGEPRAAMCVQDVDVQCVLQFTLSNAASCALHRLASRVIHRSEVGFGFVFKGRELFRTLPATVTRKIREKFGAAVETFEPRRSIPRCGTAPKMMASPFCQDC